MLIQAQEYLANKKILILDKSSTSRQLVELSLLNLGAEKTSITSLKSFTHALEFVRINKPDIIFTDFQIYDRFGLDLVPFQKEYCSNYNDRVFVLVTENANDSAVVNAAEEEVDGYILKPFTTETITEHLQRIIEQKLTPNHYKTMIAKAKSLQQLGHVDDAMIHFEMAVNLTAKPSLALYHIGEIYRQQEKYSEAITYFKQGQKITPLHFRCLVAEFMTLCEIDDFENAYKLLGKISAHYPLSPKVLKYAFSICVKTYRFEDVEKYYMHYLQLERKTEDLKVRVSTSLLEAGKSLLLKNKPDEALDYFLKGCVVIDKGVSYLHQVVDTLLTHQKPNVAETFVAMFGPDEIGTKLHKQIMLKITSYKAPHERLMEMRKIA